MFFLTVIVRTKNNCMIRFDMDDRTSKLRKKLRKKTSNESSNLVSIKEVTHLLDDKFEIVIQTESERLLGTFKTNVVTWFREIFDEYLVEAKKHFPNIQEDEVTIALQEETPLQLLEKAQEQEVEALTKKLKSTQLLEMMRLKENHEEQLRQLNAKLSQKHAAQRAALSEN